MVDRRLIVAVGVLALAACASAGPRPGTRRDLALRADPSAVVAAELAFAREAQERGQWTAFARSAADGAVMFVPEKVDAKTWLKGRENPAIAVRWQPHQVWSSCDGTLAVTRGAWQRPTGVGYFTTVWQRQRDGSYKWIMDQGDALEKALDGTDTIDAKVADCSLPAAPPALSVPGAQPVAGSSAQDETLTWQVFIEPGNARTFVARYWDGTAWQEAVRTHVAAS